MSTKKIQILGTLNSANSSTYIVQDTPPEDTNLLWIDTSEIDGGNGSGQNVNGLSSAASALLITILRNGVYSTDQSANITALENALASGGGEPDIPDVPVDPDEPHVHSYTATVTTPATCETAGVRTYACSCGHSYTEAIPALGHNYEGGVCTNCGAADPDYEAPENNGWVADEPYVIEWTDGYKVDQTTGENVADTARSVSGFIPCLGVSGLVGGSGINGGYLYAYDADKTYLGRIIFGTAYPAAVNRNVAFIKFHCLTGSKATATLVPQVYEELTDSTAWETGKYYQASYIEDKQVLDSTGAEIDKAAYWASDFMLCYGATSIYTTLIASTSWRNWVAFYDADRNYVSGGIGNAVPWTVPENAMYFRLSGIDGFEYTIQKPNRPWIQLA